MKIAVLSLQGAFIEHEQNLKKLGIDYLEIRQKKDLEKSFDGLIIPGGESTTQGRLLHELDLYDTLKTKIENGLPVFGTCAGLIMLAQKIANDERVHLATMPIEVVRNAYGRQLGSFSIIGKFNNKNIPMVFIRAPYIKKVDKNCQILSVFEKRIVAAQYNNQLVTAFHPELTNDTSVHEYFISIVNKYLNNKGDN